MPAATAAPAAVATKLTKDNYQDVIQQAIDADQTLMVRWIASEG